MGARRFDIYQTSRGYRAVTNEVRCQILAALAEREMQLPELVELTGKSKPTLSSIHLKRLIEEGIVDERAHPTDSRKKIYRVVAKKIGSSSVPVEQLRAAVSDYVQQAPRAAQFPLRISLESIAAAPPRTAASLVEAQGRALGQAVHAIVPGESGRELFVGLGGLVEQQGLARPLALDYESGTVTLEPLGAISRERIAMLAPTMAGFFTGVLHAKRLSGSFEVVRLAAGAAGRFALRYTGPMSPPADPVVAGASGTENVSPGPSE